MFPFHSIYPISGQENQFQSSHPFIFSDIKLVYFYKINLILSARMWRGVAGHDQIQSLLSLEERVRQDDVLEELQLGILTNIRIYVEEHGHVHFLIRIQLLFLKAETLDLVEIRSCLKRNNIVRADPDHRFVRGILGSVEGQRCFSGEHLQVRLNEYIGPFSIALQPTLISPCCGLKFHRIEAPVSALNLILNCRSFRVFIPATFAPSCTAPVVPP